MRLLFAKLGRFRLKAGLQTESKIMKMKNIRITKFTLAMMILLVVQFSNVIAQQPKTPEEWFELGNKQNEQKQYSQAVKSFSECIRLDKTETSCFINRGVAYFKLEKHTEALSDYSAAIKLDPKSALAYMNRGLLYILLKKYSEAKSDLSKVLEIEPNNKAATDNLANLNKITDEFSFGDIDLDSDIFKKVCLSGNCVNGKGKSEDYRGIYEGDFVDNEFQGKGKRVSGNGDIYEGDFANGKQEGQGKATYSNGETYEGEWFHDFKMLEGKATFPNGDSYNGNYAFGKFQFQGTYTYKNGNYYVGEWKDGKRNGYGKEFTKATNITREGTWKDDVYVGK